MANYPVFWTAFCVLACIDIGLVQTANKCETHADCKGATSMVCCGILSGNNERRCMFGSCLNSSCSNDSDCDDPSMCCRSNVCVNESCSGCTNDTDCSIDHYCCKGTFPFNQTFCGVNCINESCNSDDDCGRPEECCSSGKCGKHGCNYTCTSNSDCNLGQHCCRISPFGDGCRESCVDEICNSDEDCGGPQECCMCNKCVISGCPGCTSNSNCSTGHYCCRKERNGHEVGECSANCIGKHCVLESDCAGPGETCNSNNTCVTDIPPSYAWWYSLITVGILVSPFAIFAFVHVLWRLAKRCQRRPANLTRSGRTVPLVSVRTDRITIPSLQSPNVESSV